MSYTGNVPVSRRIDTDFGFVSITLTFTYCLTAGGLRGIIDDFTTSFLHVFLLSTAVWKLVNPRPVHPLTLSSHLFFCLPCLLPLFTVSCKMVLARAYERDTCPYHVNFHFFTMVWSSCGPIACWILAQTFLLMSMIDKHTGRGM